MTKEYKIKNSENYDNSALKLMILAMVVYIISYLGRKSYNSNMNEIMSFFKVDKPSAGLTGTFFFVAYACGQVFHGIMCKRYNPKYVVFGALLVASVCNVLVGIMPVNGFRYLKYIWLVNGFVSASLWSIIIRLFNRVFSKKRLKQALVFMAFPVSIGTFLIYGTSALFSYLEKFKYTFYFSSILLAAIALIWFLNVDKLIYKSKIEKSETDEEEIISPEQTAKGKIDVNFYVVFSVLAFFAIVNNFVKDGLTDWTPTIFTEMFKLDNWFSVLLTMLLPLFAVLGANFAILISRRIKNYVSVCGVLYVLATAVLVLLLVLLSNINSWFLTLVCFMLVSALMAGVNNVLTSIFPLQVKGNVDAGLVAGLIDGFCYVGSAAASYGLGSIAENMSWNAIMYLFTALCLLCVLTVVVFLIIQKIKNRKIA